MTVSQDLYTIGINEMLVSQKAYTNTRDQRNASFAKDLPNILGINEMPVSQKAYPTY